MITNSKDRIPTSQAAVILINYILAVGILTLPRTAAEKVNTPDIWITVILGGLIAMIAGIIMVKLSQQFPGKTFYQYNQEIVGKWVGAILSLFIVGYFFMLSSFEVKTLEGITSFFLLEGTPGWAIIMPFMWVSLYLNLGGINSIARLFEIIFPITVFIFLFTSFMSIGIFEIDNLRPVLGLGIIPVLKGLKTTTLAYSGAEIMLLLLAFMKQPRQAVKVVLIGTAIPLIFYVTTVVMVIGTFSVDGVLMRTWPTIDLMRSFELPGLIFERFESLLLVVWIMQIFATYTICYYAAALGLAQLFNKNIHSFLYGLLPVIYIVSQIPKNINDLFKLGDVIGNAAMILFGILPLLLLVISRWRKRKNEPKCE
ncbi:spore germination protein [Bacillus pseudomycoides]|uniref:spore germination protein n=1 Tax=Bacillus pseudomycoides TaxID=64104 RepID=UPI000504F839|nr:spore germination protein [Bacillus pseudomycoides]KFN13964.1 spore germination protein YndE [Bacillus pseudomycoides]MDR4187501.1 GerAB/ArcD/ProY family transporter [Bacillus pseudomycoides]MED0853934.1 spore germination protein [Bacillus pseudomycoides]PDZ73329.1 spore gernimation protein [Bacillus pseudomycoides]PFY93656.1 spore gernimation protein [Bacillus pseudomycoides]